MSDGVSPGTSSPFKGFKVMSALDHLTAAVHGCNVQGTGQVPSVISAHGTGLCSVQYMIVIDFSQGMVSGMEMVWHLLNLPDDNGAFDQAVESPFQDGTGHGRGGMEIGGLSHGMDSGIGAARSRESDGLVQDDGKRFLYFSLDGHLTGLDLPPGIGSAVIFNGDFIVFSGLGHGLSRWGTGVEG